MTNQYPLLSYEELEKVFCGIGGFATPGELRAIIKSVSLHSDHCNLNRRVVWNPKKVDLHCAFNFMMFAIRAVRRAIATRGKES